MPTIAQIYQANPLVPAGTEYVLVQQANGTYAAVLLSSLASGILPNSNTVLGATYTLQASDNNKNVFFTSSSAVTVTIPATLPASFSCTCWQQGAGSVAFNGTAVAAATVNVPSSATASGKIGAQYGAVGVVGYTNTAGNNLVVNLGGNLG